MNQHDQENRTASTGSVTELKTDELEKVSGGGQPVQLPKKEEKDR